MAGFQLSLLLGIFSAFALLIYSAPRGQRGAWFDVGLGALVGGWLIGRVAHIVFHWHYFSVNQHEMLQLSADGWSWQGVLIGALMGAWLVARWRRVAWGRWLDATALLLPLLSLALWSACWSTSCAYGTPIPLDASVAPWLVHDAMDAYGIPDLRYATQPLGVAFSLPLLVVAVLLHRISWASGRRWGVMLVGVALISWGVGFLRADPILNWTLLGVTLRADQWADLSLIILGATSAIVSRAKDVIIVPKFR